jgi:hypothetical protein
MKHNAVAVVGALIFLTCVETVQAQTTTLRYGQIPSTIKAVSALQFYIAQRKGFFARERVNLEMISIEGGGGEYDGGVGSGYGRYHAYGNILLDPGRAQRVRRSGHCRRDGDAYL